jgi:hypothetical protein
MYQSTLDWCSQQWLEAQPASPNASWLVKTPWQTWCQLIFVLLTLLRWTLLGDEGAIEVVLNAYICCYGGLSD